jgi:hypothetical protein
MYGKERHHFLCSLETAMSNSIKIQVSSIVCQHISDPIVTWHILPRNIAKNHANYLIYCPKVWIILLPSHMLGMSIKIFCQVILFRDLWYKILNTCKLCSLWNYWNIIQEETFVT